MKISTKTLFLSLIVTLSALLNAGCADLQRKGPEAYLFPVTYSLSLKIAPQQQENAQQKQQQFLVAHKEHLFSKEIELLWSSEAGRAWALKTEQQLLQEGVSRNNITVKQNLVADVQYFDYQINITAYKVEFTTCPRFSSGSYEQKGEGCFSEQARWRSMVNPQKMLVPVNKSTHQ